MSELRRAEPPAAQLVRAPSAGPALSVRRLRTVLVELGVGEDADTVPLPPSLERVLEQVRAALDGRPRTSAP